MKMKIFFAGILAAILIVCASCGSTDNVAKEVTYVEVDAKELTSGLISPNNLASLYRADKRNILVRNISLEHAAFFKLGDLREEFKSLDFSKVLAETPYLKEWAKTERICTVKATITTNPPSPMGTPYVLLIDSIEDLPTQEEFEAEKQAKAQERAELIATVKKIQADKKQANDEKAKAIAKGYTYHGIDEAEKNARLFTNRALEIGHAYYLSDFRIANNLKSFAQVSGGTPVLVEYATQTLKGEILEAEKADVVVVGDKAITRVIGFIDKYDHNYLLDADSFSSEKLKRWFNIQ